MRRLSAIALLPLLLAGAAHAKTWDVNYAQSHLGFEGKQGDAAFQGGFAKFDVKIDFDPAKPEAGKITATIDTSSATAGSSERDSFLPQADWFDVKNFPQAQFASTSIKSTGTDKTGIDCYEAAGALTIKGISKPLALPFCLAKEGDHYRARGKVALMRQDYHVGEHDWASETYVKFGVDVTVDLEVKPKD